jgi:type IV secretory pathway VirB10-like protein
MSDELTPEEREALNNLPRERMPVGLETRVVDAMREHGFLARRRRTIVLTNTRAAGVLAAGVALIIGAYSIGLHRGEGEETLRTIAQQAPSSVPPAEDAPAPAQSPPATAPAPETDRLESQDAPVKDALERARANESSPEAEALAPAPTVLGESKKDLDWQLKPKEEERADASKSTASRLAPQAGGASGRILAMDEASDARPRWITYQLDGKTVFVEAPDSVRVVEDEQGRMLLIYTSDGIIRIRLAD